MIIGLALTPGRTDNPANCLATLLKNLKDIQPEDFPSRSSIRSAGDRLAIAVSNDQIKNHPKLTPIPLPDHDLLVISDVQIRPSPSTLPRSVTAAPLEWDLPGRWIAIDVPRDTKQPILWSTDPLGALWLYFTETTQGVVFSDDFRVLSRLAGPTSEVDPHAVRRALVLGYMLGNETLHPSVLLAPPGSVFEWISREGFRIHQTHRLRYGDSLAGKSDAERLDAVIGAFESAAAGWREVIPERTAISLSAGLDSRTALGYLSRTGLRLPSFTFGHPDSKETQGAARIAERLGLDSHTFPVPEISWSDWATDIQQLGATGQVQRCGWASAWLEYLQQHAEAIVHGYLGDALTGKHLSPQAEAPTDWINYWTSWSVGPEWHAWPGLRIPWRDNMIRDLEDDFRAEADSADTVYPYQKAMHLDLYCRQRRWVATQANELGRVVTPVCFFYHPAVLHTWTNLRYEDIMGQALYKRANHTVFPELFDNPSMRRGHQTTSARRLASRMRHLLRGNLFGEPRRPRVITRSLSLISTRRESLDRLMEVRGLIDEVVDFNYVSNAIRSLDQQTPSESESARLLRVLNVAHVLALFAK
jgi:hypothetical protein